MNTENDKYEIVIQTQEKIERDPRALEIDGADDCVSIEDAHKLIDLLEKEGRRFLTITADFHTPHYLLTALIQRNWKLETSSSALDSDNRAFQFHNFVYQP